MHCRVVARVSGSLEGRKVVGPINGRNYDSYLAAGDEFGIHHDSSDAPISICEWVNLGSKNHHEHRSRKRTAYLGANVEPSSESSYYEFWGDELGTPSSVGFPLKVTRHLVRTARHQPSVSGA